MILLEGDTRKLMATKKIGKIFNRVTKSKQIHECVLLVENTSGDFSYSKGFGNKHIDTPFIIASITKLFTTACILILQEQGKLLLDYVIRNYVDRETRIGQHIYKAE